MNTLYPLKFKPIFKEKIWGGQKAKTLLGMDFSPLPNCGEAWMLSGVKEFESVVTNGFLAGNTLTELVEIYMYDLVGDKNYNRFNNEFPILIKFIDANEWLSIQVHPDDDLAKKRKIGRGKTEMWYILDADEGSELISGFKRKVNRNVFLNNLKNSTLKEIMNIEKVGPGDVFLMPAGRVHALGPGIFLAEIQETSDITYRIYDWDRMDDEGKSRELHTEEALDAIDYEMTENYKIDYDKNSDQTIKLVNCNQFTTNLIHLSNHNLEKDLSFLDTFVVYICVKGKAELAYNGGKEEINIGEVILVPAIFEELTIRPQLETELLEVFVL